MRPQEQVLATIVLLLVLGGTGASAAGTGTFSLSNATAVLGQNGIATLSLNATRDPPASEVLLNLRYDPGMLGFQGARFLVGGTASATRIQPGAVLVQVVDLAGGLGSGPIAEVTFQSRRNGSSRLETEVERVRAYQGGCPVEITDSATVAPGLFTVLATAPAANATAAPAPTIPPLLPSLPPQSPPSRP